jgi:predicted ArsR family transcriptional regulator
MGTDGLRPGGFSQTQIVKNERPITYTSNSFEEGETIMSDQDQIIEQKLAEQRSQLRRGHTEHLVFVLRGLEKKLGPQVVEAYDEVAGAAIRQEWHMYAEKEGSNTIEDLILLLWEPLRAQGFEYTMEERDGGVQMHCTRCPHAILAQSINASDWLYHLYCGSDPHIVAGFNPNIEFRRTKTLVQGDDCCDHFYKYKDA